MIKKKLLATMLVASFLLAACGEDKKISMGINNTEITSPVVPPERNYEDYQKYIEEYGKKLAPFHHIYWKEKFNTYIGYTPVEIEFDTFTNVECISTDSVYHLKKFANNEATKEQIVRAYLGNGDIYPDDDESCWNKERIQQEINWTRDDISYIETLIKNPEEYGVIDVSSFETLLETRITRLKELEALLVSAPEELTPTTTFTGLSYWTYAPNSNEKITLDLQWTGDVKVIGGMYISYYPFEIKDSSTYSAVAKSASELFEKINLIPCNSNADMLYSDSRDFVEHNNFYFKNGIVQLYLDLGSLPRDKNYSLSHSSVDFQTDKPSTIMFDVINPLQFESKTEDVPLLAWSEIKKIALQELRTNIEKYSDYVNNGTLYIGPYINLEQVTVEDGLNVTLLPAWTFNTNYQSGNSGKVTVLTINAIDGSIIKNN